MKKLLFFLLICTNSIFAQFRQKEVYTVYINYPDYTIKANVSNAKKKINAKESLTYHWYASNKILETKGGYDGKMLEGPYTSFYLSANLKEKGCFKKGLKDGEWTSWNENGKINSITAWRNGEKNGVCKTFDDNEKLASESHYRNNELHGALTNYENGKIVRQVKYKKGQEVIQQPRKEKQKKETKEASGKDVSADKSKKTFKEKIGAIFQKKEKDKKQPSEKKIAPKEEKTKKSLKEKFASIFKKKEKSGKQEKAANSGKPVKPGKAQAAK